MIKVNLKEQKPSSIEFKDLDNGQFFIFRGRDAIGGLRQKISEKEYFCYEHDEVRKLSKFSNGLTFDSYFIIPVDVEINQL